MSDQKYPSPSAVPERRSVKVSVDWLSLDPDNPRLVLASSLATDDEIIGKLYRIADLDELIQSISANGYMDIEPLIVCLSEDNSDKFTVIEGNRRLATIKLFRDPELREKIKKRSGFSINVPELEGELKRSLDNVTVYRVGSRQESRQFVGFKHINGTAKWSSYAKAKFAADWYRDKPEKGLQHIAEMIGDQHNTVKRMVFAIYVLEQAENKDLFSIQDRNTGRFGFSHLYVALTRSDYLQHLGLDEKWADYEIKVNPVSADKEDNLEELLLWIYGSKEKDILPVVKSQNPDIRRLGEVIANQKSLNILIDSRDLDHAHSSIAPKDRVFSRSLTEAEIRLADAQESIIGYDGSNKSLLDTANTAKDRITVICKIMEDKISGYEKGDIEGEGGHEKEDGHE